MPSIKMNKRLILAVLLSMLTLMVYSYVYRPPQKPLPTETEEGGPVYQLKPAPLGELGEEQPGSMMKLDEATVVPQGAKDVIVETNLFRVTFTTSGGRIKSCRLKQHKEILASTGEIKKEIEKTKAPFQGDNLIWLLDHLKQRNDTVIRLKGALKEAREGGQDEEVKLILDQLATEKGVELVSVESVRHRDYPLTIRLQDEERSKGLNLAIYKPDREELVLDREEGTITFTSSLIDGLRVKKRFTFSPNSYTILLELMIEDEVSRPLSEGWFLLGYGPEIGLPEATVTRRYGYQGPITMLRTTTGDIINKEKYGRDDVGRYIRREHLGQILWTAIENKYFIVALIPQAMVQVAMIEKGENETQWVALKMPFEGKDVYRFRLYLGPKEEERLKELGVGLENVIERGFFSPIAKLLSAILGFFYGWTHNYGWAIILLSLSIKLAFYPLTHKSFESMQKMQEDMKRLQPELDKLKREHGNNPRKLQKEQMELYRRSGVNPMAGCRGGCLPMLLQMPVFFALYVVLYNSIDLRGASFMGWIVDLSSRDPYYVLPILMGVSMVVQQKLTGTGGGAQQDQAKIMMWTMPILFTWIFARLPSGIVLYWFTFNILTSIQQLLIKKRS